MDGKQQASPEDQAEGSLLVCAKLPLVRQRNVAKLSSSRTPTEPIPPPMHLEALDGTKSPTKRCYALPKSTYLHGRKAALVARTIGHVRRNDL